ncbi:type II toxin-antitoxin system RelE/ParE family toxin [Rhodopila globiformis]|uniref:Addiction module antitoxin RelB n=1 Tax=Rhodopila globiformis TaxID=1071 RepID=A0A2S6NNX6_RHOGL|nr:type II toxin-antitoxin system RelE/ParE family toxin [Rhodopila globiformis]PPQ39546.1 addiction module antitoxin RelB [Rhodopila globiformis]
MVQTRPFEVLQHVVFRDWLNSLRDAKAKARIVMRIAYLSQGNAGDFKAVGESVLEMRIHYGPGYRVYYKQTGRTVIILLCGGDKSTQDRDIRQARELAATV